MATSRLEEAMAELARSRVQFLSLRTGMKNSQAKISQPPQFQNSPIEKAMIELAESQAKFANFQP